MRRWWVFGLWSKLLWGQSSAFQAPAPYFEGVISYKVKISGPQAEILRENAPNTEMHIYIQGNRFLVNETGGGFPVSRLYEPDSDWVYVLDPRNKRAFRYEKYRKKAQNYPAQYIGDSLQVAGVWCYGFKVKKPYEEIIYYASPKYRVNTALFAGKKRAQAFFLNEGLYGAIPLKIIRKREGLTIETTAVQVRAMRLDSASMRLPKDYQIWGYDYRR
ncbi:MAG: hypothetical protein NZ958_07105 [Bacteroidia bacterium]|nr:hypothetical protein [Bacteroidia bacterium]MDW8089466.1 hypothetical protein [Bacteroidia bacterium]